jgi:hypothetical protein
MAVMTDMCEQGHTGHALTVHAVCVLLDSRKGTTVNAMHETISASESNQRMLQRAAVCSCTAHGQHDAARGAQGASLEQGNP